MALNCSKSPCSNCPYRTDAPLAHWDKQEFVDLLASENDDFGKLYQCHKKNGKLCTGWVMNQVARNLPSIALRISFARQHTTNDEADALRCRVPLFPTVQAMAYANFPELNPKKSS